MRALFSVASIGVACFLLAGCGDETTSPPSSPSAAASTPVTTATPGPLPEVTQLDAALKIVDTAFVDWVLTSARVAWVATNDGVRRYAADGSILGTTAVGGPICLAMDAGFDAIWAGVCGREAAVVRIDPATGEVIARIPIDGDLMAEGSLGAGEGAVWAITEDPARLVRIDPATNLVSATFESKAGGAGVRAGEGGVWVTFPDAGEVRRIDPATGQVVRAIQVGRTPRFLTVAYGGVWVMNNSDGSVSHIDPTTNDVMATVDVDLGPVDGGDIAAGGGAVWARVSSSVVSRIDPEADVVSARFGSPSGSGSVAADDDAVWMTAHDVNAIWRLPLE